MNYSVPKLTFFKGADKKKHWMIEFHCTNPDDINERKRFQYRFKINQERTEQDKILEGNANAGKLSQYLNAGWNPYIQTPGEWLRAQKGGFVNRPKLIGECIDEAYQLKLKHLTGDESPRTYRYIHKHFTKWLADQMLTKLKPESFTGEHALAYADHLTNEGKQGRTFNNYRSIVKILFNMLVDRDLIAKNPFSKVKLAKTTEAEMYPFTDLELEEIRARLKEYDYNLYVYAQVIFYTLARPIEVMKFKMKYIDLRKGLILIPAQISKNRKSRICNIPPALMKLLTEYTKNAKSQDFLFSKAAMGVGAVGNNRRQDFSDEMKIHLKALNFDSKLSLYSFKYSGVIAAYMAGISIEEIRIQAGHSSLEMTQIYMRKLGLIKPSGFGSVDY